MTALHFGDSDSPLFGVWTQPSPDVDHEHGVVLCPPIGQEHVRSHWAIRQAAASLSRAGFHSLRFDWFGVGDSAGELEEASLARWREDLQNAAQELRDSAGVRSVSFVGLRFGATLAALAAEDLRPAAIILWDPVVRGRDYVSALRTLTQELLSDPLRYWNHEGSRRARATELVGFDFGDRLLAEIEQTTLVSSTVPSHTPVCLLSSSPDLGGLRAQLRESHPHLDVRETEIQAKWTSPESVEELLLPGDALRALTEFLEAHAA